MYAIDIKCVSVTLIQDINFGTVVALNYIEVSNQLNYW
jgi:hypothetical protein